jgi:hypothetical protein
MPADWHDPQMWTHYKAQVHEDFGRMLRHQLAGCQAQECRARLQAAHDWLVWHELHDLATDILPMPDCPNVMSVDLMKGARCTAVQIDMCPKASLNDTQSFFRCEQALKDGAWMANPKAQALDLDKWVRPKGP